MVLPSAAREPRIQKKRLRFGNEGGQAAIFGALTLTLMFSVMGLSVDLGWAYFLKQRVQTAADAAASAAAKYAMDHSDACGVAGVSCGSSYTCAGVSPPNNSLQEGCLFATADGPPVLTAQMYEYDAAHPPSNLSGVTPSIWVQATVSASSPNVFLLMSGFKTSSITANAIGGVMQAAAAGNCIYALSSANPAITASGSGNITTTCGIMDNGGLTFTGSGNIDADPQILVNGDFKDSGSGNISVTATPSSNAKIQVGGTYKKTGPGNISPAHVTGTTAITDPFSTLTPPPVGGCDNTNYNYSGAGNTTINPGVYCGGIKISGSGNVTFNSGLYILVGGQGANSFAYSGSGNLSGTNVTFFITGNNTYPSMPIQISGSGNVIFSAQSSGQYMGLLFYQDPLKSYAGTNTYSGSGNVTGTFYFPTTNLSYSGSGNALAQALVAQTISFTGSGNFVKDLTGKLTGMTKTSMALLQ